MPIADPQARRAYQREWLRRRRAAYLADKVCLRCGASENLEVHHFVTSEKLAHAIWSWSAKRREAELAKCVILCGGCHDEYHASLKRKPCGTIAAYDHRGCRCGPCRVAKAEYRRARLAGVTV